MVNSFNESCKLESVDAGKAGRRDDQPHKQHATHARRDRLPQRHVSAEGAARNRPDELRAKPRQ